MSHNHLRPTPIEEHGPDFSDASRLRVTLTRPPEAEREYVARLERDGVTVGWASGMRWPYQIVQLVRAIFYAMCCIGATHYTIERPVRGPDS